MSNLKRNNQDINKFYDSADLVKKAYRSGRVIWQLMHKPTIKTFVKFYTEEEGLQTINISGEFYYSYNGTDWLLVENSASWGTADKRNIYIARNSNASIGTITFSTDVPVSITYGDINGLYRCYEATDSAVHNTSYNSLFSGCTQLRRVANSFLPALEVTANQYQSMFQGCTGLTQAPVLPATKLFDHCYHSMFQGCTSLSGLNAINPTLPATNIYTNAYEYMFAGCASLVNAPALPATKIGFAGYKHMFKDCTSLTTAPALPATTLFHSNYYYMFEGCTALTQAPVLPATSLYKNCCWGMFKDCVSLTTAPALPVTTLVEGCYCSMFQGCTGLTTAPELPATTMEYLCYGYMFSGCTSLVQAPNLPATTLAEKCYQQMFKGCTSLNEVHTDATDISASACTENWLRNVASSGTFYGKDEAGWLVDSPSGIPVGWKRPAASYVSFTSSAAQTVTKPSGSNMEYSYDQTNWSSMTSAVSFGSDKPTVYVRGKNTSGINAGFTFGNTTAMVNIGGNCQALLDWENLPTSVPSNGFKGLFGSAIAVQSVSSNFLPATNLADYCYSGMFSFCRSLVNAPALPATTLTNNCYSNMFMWCTSLTTAPALPSTELASFCYSYMFAGCTSLASVPELSATTLAIGCYNTMFSGCTSLVSATELPATTLQVYCYNSMYSQCTALTQAPILSASTLPEGSYQYMFSGCSSLTEVHCYATNISALRCTNNWVNGVSSTGDFYGKAEAGWSTGESGIPSVWTQHLE